MQDDHLAEQEVKGSAGREEPRTLRLVQHLHMLQDLDAKYAREEWTWCKSRAEHIRENNVVGAMRNRTFHHHHHRVHTVYQA